MGELEKENVRLKGELDRWMSQKEQERQRSIERGEKVDRIEDEFEALIDKLKAFRGEIEKTNAFGGTVETLTDQLEKSFQEVSGRVGGVESKVDEIEDKVENLGRGISEEIDLLVKKVDTNEKENKDGITKLEERYMMLGEKIERLYDLFGRIENALQENEKRIDEMERENAKLQKRMMYVDCNIVQYQKEVDQNIRGLRGLATKVDELRNIFTDSAQDLTKRLAWLENYLQKPANHVESLQRRVWR
ncbi:hypothetical protein KP509_03G083200 [Ceratopteris richardii]|uniref:Uncharacterized protein n=1 Tax=Ceratopteris richardii TaxID=49495 RepID=A0A8T2V8K9_CERRI|nr:hypothetical protein KP509_03G083200 [Ceratopteris richardii]